jgi:hypothetical protein
VFDLTGAASVRAVLVCHSLAPWLIFERISFLGPLLMSKRWEVNSVEVLFQPYSILACGKLVVLVRAVQDRQFARPPT